MTTRQWRSQKGGGGRGGWSSAPNPRTTLPQECCLLGAPPPRPPPERGLGRSVNQVWGRSPQLHSCGEAAPGFGAEPKLPAYMFQSSQPVWSAARGQICLNPVCRVGCEDSRSEPNWIQTNLATKRRDQTGGLIES